MADQSIPVLQEHQSGRSTDSVQPTGYQATPEEKSALKLVERLFSKAKTYRKKYDEHWLDWYKMFRGKQWKEQRPSYRHSEVINFIFQTIQSEVPILTDARQRFEFIAEEPTDYELAKILDQVAESDWISGNWTYKLAEVLYDSAFYGTGLGHMPFNPKAKLGLGAIEFDSEDPFYCFPDPNSFDVNGKSQFFIVAKPEDIEVLKRDYPEKAKYIKPDLIDLIDGDRTDFDEVRYKSPVDNKSVVEGTRPDEMGKKNQALKIECYLKSDEFEESEEDKRDEKGELVTDEMGEPVKHYVQKLKYPNGRRICIAGGVVVSDGPNPYDDGDHPYARICNYIDPRSFWGISDIEQLEGPQKVFNKIYSFVLDVLTLMGNPIWVVDDTSGLDTDHLINRPGLIVEKAQGSEVRRESGVQLQPYVLSILDRVSEYIKSIGGAQDVSTGVRPDGVTAASAISKLQEAAQTRLRQKSRNLDAFLQNLGKLYLSRLFQFYDSPRIVRVTGDDQAQKYFKFHIENREHEDGSQKKMAVVREYVQNPGSGQYSESLDSKEYEMRGSFDVRVSTGSSLPFAKDVKFQQARQMFLDGVIDAEEYLKAADYPNWQAVLQRTQEKMAQAQAQQAQQQGQVSA